MPLEVSTPTPSTICIVRTFKAPPQLVFDCHTRPALIRRWMLGPPGWSMPVCEVDLRVDGKYRYRWRNDENGREFGSEGEHLEIGPPGRLVTTERMEGFSGQATNTMVLAEHAGGTRMTLLLDYGSQNVRDQALQSGMTGGMEQSYQRIDAIAAEAGA